MITNFWDIISRPNLIKTRRFGHESCIRLQVKHSLLDQVSETSRFDQIKTMDNDLKASYLNFLVYLTTYFSNGLEEGM
jgi:hypothetical protein